MAWYILANLSSGNQPLSILDTQFNNVAAWGRVICTASGTNDITLTPSLSGFAALTYADGHQYFFIAAATSTGAVTLKVGAQAARNVYRADGTAQVAANDIVSGHAYAVTYNSALNSGTGGWYLEDLSIAYGRQTIWVPAVAMYARTTNGAATGSVEMTTNKNMFKTLDFDPDTTKYAQFEVAFPKSWNLGTLSYQAIWSHASASTNFGVVWNLAAVARSDGDAGDVAFGTAADVTDTGGTANAIYISPESGALTVAGSPAQGCTVQFQVSRDAGAAADTLAVDARLHGIRIYYATRMPTDD